MVTILKVCCMLSKNLWSDAYSLKSVVTGNASVTMEREATGHYPTLKEEVPMVPLPSTSKTRMSFMPLSMPRTEPPTATLASSLAEIEPLLSRSMLLHAGAPTSASTRRRRPRHPLTSLEALLLCAPEPTLEFVQLLLGNLRVELAALTTPNAQGVSVIAASSDVQWR